MRDKAIDLAKGLGSVWIILSHTGSYFPFAKYFYYMYVPIFFVCSGYTFRKRDSLKADFINVFNRLFIPMLLCRLCMIIFDLFWNIKNGTNIFQLRILYQIIRNNLYSRYMLLPWNHGGDNVAFFAYGGGEWFLPALILSTILFICIYEKGENYRNKYVYYASIAIMLIVISIVFNNLPILLPWSIDTVPTFTIFMIFGSILKRYDFMKKPLDIKIIPVIACACIIFKYIADYNGDINISIRMYGFHGALSVVLYTANAINACFLILIACKWFAKKELFNELSIIGQYTLILYCFNGNALALLETFIGKAVDLGYENCMYNLIRSVLCICLLISIAFVYRKHIKSKLIVFGKQL